MSGAVSLPAACLSREVGTTLAHPDGMRARVVRFDGRPRWTMLADDDGTVRAADDVPWEEHRWEDVEDTRPDPGVRRRLSRLFPDAFVRLGTSGERPEPPPLYERDDVETPAYVRVRQDRPATDENSTAIHRNSMTVQVSRDFLVEQGLAEPTRVEWAKHEHEISEYRRAQREREERLGRLRTALDALTEQPTRVVLDLHRPEPAIARDGLACRGCAEDTFNDPETSDQPSWPCATVLLLADHHGIETCGTR